MGQPAVVVAAGFEAVQFIGQALQLLLVVIDHGLMAFQDDREQVMVMDVPLDLREVFSGRGIELPERLPQLLEFMALRAGVPVFLQLVFYLLQGPGQLGFGVVVGRGCRLGLFCSLRGCNGRLQDHEHEGSRHQGGCAAHVAVRY